jgi:hypothetical protein
MTEDWNGGLRHLLPKTRKNYPPPEASVIALKPFFTLPRVRTVVRQETSTRVSYQGKQCRASVAPQTEVSYKPVTNRETLSHPGCSCWFLQPNRQWHSIYTEKMHRRIQVHQRTLIIAIQHWVRIGAPLRAVCRVQVPIDLNLVNN